MHCCDVIPVSWHTYIIAITKLVTSMKILSNGVELEYSRLVPRQKRKINGTIKKNLDEQIFLFS